MLWPNNASAIVCVSWSGARAIARAATSIAGLSRKPWQGEGFYLILTAALVVSIVLALLRFNPIQFIFWANILVGILAPILVVYIIMVGNNSKIMRNQRLGSLTNFFLVLTAVILVAAAVVFFYELAMGQGG